MFVSILLSKFPLEAETNQKTESRLSNQSYLKSYTVDFLILKPITLFHVISAEFHILMTFVSFCQYLNA